MSRGNLLNASKPCTRYTFEIFRAHFKTPIELYFCESDNFLQIFMSVIFKDF